MQNLGTPPGGVGGCCRAYIPQVNKKLPNYIRFFGVGSDFVVLFGAGSDLFLFLLLGFYVGGGGSIPR